MKKSTKESLINKTRIKLCNTRILASTIFGDD